MRRGLGERSATNQEEREGAGTLGEHPQASSLQRPHPDLCLRLLRASSQHQAPPIGEAQSDHVIHGIPRATSGKQVGRQTKSTQKTALASQSPLILGPLPFLRVQPEGQELEAEQVGTSEPLQP